MATPVRQKASRVSLRLRPREKELIEWAASLKGQTLEEYAVSTLMEAANRAAGLPGVTRVSPRDGEMILAMLDDETIKPTKALKEAVKRYKKSGIKSI